MDSEMFIVRTDVYLLVFLLATALPVTASAAECMRLSDWYSGITCRNHTIAARDQQILAEYQKVFAADKNTTGFLHALHLAWYEATADVCRADTATSFTTAQLTCLAERYPYHQYMWVNGLKMLQEFDRTRLISMQQYANQGDTRIIHALQHEKLAPVAVSIVDKNLPVFYVFHDDGEKRGIYFYDSRSAKIVKILSRLSEMTAIRNIGDDYQMLFSAKSRAFDLTDEQYFLSTLMRSTDGFIVTAKNIVNARYYCKDDLCGKSMADSPDIATATIVRHYQFGTAADTGRPHIDFSMDKTDCRTNLTTTVSVDKKI